jgi:hypothetical protein
MFDKNIDAPPLTFSEYPVISAVVPILRDPDAVMRTFSPKALEKAIALDAGLRSVPPEDKEIDPTPEMELVFIFTLEIAGYADHAGRPPDSVSATPFSQYWETLIVPVVASIV